MTDLAGVLTSRLRALWGPAVEVTGLRPRPGGASRESWDVRVRAVGQADRAGAGPQTAERRLIRSSSACAGSQKTSPPEARGPE